MVEVFIKFINVVFVFLCVCEERGSICKSNLLMHSDLLLAYFYFTPFAVAILYLCIQFHNFLALDVDWINHLCDIASAL